jgi:hypothetical protein
MGVSEDCYSFTFFYVGCSVGTTCGALAPNALSSNFSLAVRV